MIESSVWIFFVVIVYVVLALGNCDTACNNTVTVAVSRRLSNEIYTCDSSDTHYQCESNKIYLVAEQQCVNNSDLFSGK